MVIDFDKLRDASQNVPFSPMLKSETDTSYFDDFSDPKNFNLYADIKKREYELKRDHKDVKVLQSAFVGFTFRHKNC
jgi:cell cycle protein kinase DBF2